MNKSSSTPVYVQLKVLTGRGAPIHSRWLTKQIADGALETVVLDGQRVIEVKQLLSLIEHLAQAPGPDPKAPYKGWIR